VLGRRSVDGQEEVEVRLEGWQVERLRGLGLEVVRAGMLPGHAARAAG